MPEPREGRPTLSVGITTRNRLTSLARCVASLDSLADLLTDVLIVDDSSEIPIQSALDDLPARLRAKVTLIRQAAREGYIVARNAMVARARSDFVLLMDDDAFLVEDRGVRRALDLMAGHAGIGAVACALAHEDGSPWPSAMQPSPARYVSYVPAYIGFAHLVRRRLFLDLGGYRELFHFYGEEKDYCLRLINAGYHVIYDPQALVAHMVDPSGRSDIRYLRYAIRNDCLSSLYNEPLPLPLMTIPLRLYRFGKMRRHGGVHDPDGLRWIVAEILHALPIVIRDRRPVRWASLRRWRWLRRAWPAFRPEPA
jgi:GT2 family glycosyltransferase